MFILLAGLDVQTVYALERASTHRLRLTLSYFQGDALTEWAVRVDKETAVLYQLKGIRVHTGLRSCVPSSEWSLHRVRHYKRDRGLID